MSSCEKRVKDAVAKLHQARKPAEKAAAGKVLHEANVALRNENKAKRKAAAEKAATPATAQPAAGKSPKE